MLTNLHTLQISTNTPPTCEVIASYASEDSQENKARQEIHDSDANSDNGSDCYEYNHYYTDR